MADSGQPRQGSPWLTLSVIAAVAGVSALVWVLTLDRPQAASSAAPAEVTQTGPLEDGEVERLRRERDDAAQGTAREREAAQAAERERLRAVERAQAAERALAAEREAARAQRQAADNLRAHVTSGVWSGAVNWDGYGDYTADWRFSTNGVATSSRGGEITWTLSGTQLSIDGLDSNGQTLTYVGTVSGNRWTGSALSVASSQTFTGTFLFVRQ